MEPHAPQPYLIEFAPSSLHQMLVREAVFVLSRRRLTEALALAQTRERAIKATRPPFMALLPTKLKQQLSSNLEESQNTLALLQAGLDKLNLLEPQLLLHVSFRLENHLRRCSSDYVRGLASNRYPDDWVRLKTRVETCARDYHAALKSLAELCAIMPPAEMIGAQPSSRKFLSEAIARGGQLEAEVEFINKIAHAQRMLAGQEGFTLKLQPVVNWQESAQVLLSMSARKGPAIVNALVAQSEPITTQIIADLTEEVVLTLSKKAHDIASYHAGQWAALREAALLKIDPRELESLVKETETLLENGEFKSWAALDDSPVDAPPQKPAASPAKPAMAPVHAPKPVPGPHVFQTLKLPSRSVTRSPFPSAQPAPEVATAPAVSPEEVDAMAKAKAELERQTKLLEALKAELEARESFVSESENRLLEKTQSQQELEAELEQRAEELQHMETRIREAQDDALPFKKAAAVTPAPRVFNEFLE